MEGQETAKPPSEIPEVYKPLVAGASKIPSVWERIKTILKEQWALALIEIILAVIAVFGIIITLITALATFSAANESKKANEINTFAQRPKISILSKGLQMAKNDFDQKDYYLLNLKNVGEREASFLEVTSTLILIPENCFFPPRHTEGGSIAPEENPLIYLDLIDADTFNKLKPKVLPSGDTSDISFLFVKIELTWLDTLNKKDSRVFYDRFKFSVNPNGSSSVSFYSVGQKDQQTIEKTALQNGCQVQ